MPPRRLPLRARALVSAVVALLALPAAARAADVVVLENGARLTGKIVSEDAKSVVLERTSGTGQSLLTISRERIRGIERDVATAPGPAAPGAPGASARPGTTSPPATVGAAPRDEWWLLSSGGRVVGTRHLLVLPVTEGAAAPGWRLEEQVRLFPAARLPGVRVQRIEDVDASFLPRSLHYREAGEVGDGAQEASPYETIRQGPVEAGVWKESEREGGKARDVAVALPAGAFGPLGAREALARAEPRTAGVAQLALVDPTTGAVRRVRAGFSSLGGVPAAGGSPEDVLRWEDGSVVLESRWAPGQPPRCLSEQVTPGVVATPATAAQAAAAEGTAAEGAGRAFTLPDVGLTLTLPGAAWTAEALPPRPLDAGVRAVARVSGRLHAADVRVEWDPKGAVGPVAVDLSASEAALLARLRAHAPDLAVVGPRSAVLNLPGAWTMAVEGTVHGERVRTLILVADRGEARVVLLAACPTSAWDDARPALDAILASFRWL